MQTYLYQGSYTSAFWAKQLTAPKDLAEFLRPSIEGLGGRVVACFLKLSSHEPIGFVEFPDNIAAESWAMYMSSQNDVTRVELTALLSTQEGMTAMQKAGIVSSTQAPSW
jgi:uncharacterized protein with GYD domain